MNAPRKKWKSQYKVPRPIETPSILLDLIVREERAEWIRETYPFDQYNNPCVNWAGADGGKRGIARPFVGQGVSVNGRIGVFQSFAVGETRAVIKFPEGTEAVNASDVESVEYPRAKTPKRGRWIDADGDVHQDSPSGGMVFKSRERMLDEPSGYHWKPSWACSCSVPCVCGWNLITDEAMKAKSLKQTPSEILELDGEITIEAVKEAFRRLALKRHPDHGGDPLEFRKLTQARETLLAELAKEEGDEEQAA